MKSKLVILSQTLSVCSIHVHAIYACTLCSVYSGIHISGHLYIINVWLLHLWGVYSNMLKIGELSPFTPTEDQGYFKEAL